MDRAKMIIACLLLLPTLSFGMKLTSKVRNYEMVRNASGRWISAGCKKCQAETFVERLTKSQVKTALKADDRTQVPVGARVCTSLKGLVWVLLDEKNLQRAVCEFPDKSAILADDISARARDLLE